MKRALAFILSITPMSLMAGGGSGGTPPPLVDLDNLALMSIVVDHLPKAYAYENDIRRARARLSEAGVETTRLLVESEAIQVRKVHNSIVDAQISKEILPEQSK